MNLLSAVFVDRRSQLADLQDFLKNPPTAARHRAIISARRMGKSWLIGEFRRRNLKAPLVYLDVEATELRSERVALRLAAGIVTEATGQRDKADVATLAELLVVAGGKLSAAHLDRVRAYVDGASGRDTHDVVHDGLALADVIFGVGKKKAIIFFDECQSWFAGPDEEPTAYESLFREVGDASRTRYVFAGSARRVMDATFREAPEQHGRRRRPLHGRFLVMHLQSFDREDTRELVGHIWRKHKPPVEAIERVYALTRGHPAGATHLAERAKSIATTTNRRLNVEAVSEAFVIEVFERSGYLNAIAQADYAAATTQPMGADSLKKIVDAIAELEPNATQARVAALSGVAQSNAGPLLGRLVDIDFVLFDEAARTYTLANPVVGIWLRGRGVWTPGASTPIPPRIVQLLEEQVLRLSASAGTGFEALTRDVANRFDGRMLPGRLFRRTRDVVLPIVRSPVLPIEDVDREGLVFPKGTSVQLDVYINAASIWLGEARHRRHAVSAKQTTTFLDKVRFFEKTRGWANVSKWFVSDSGFEDKAIMLAEQNDVLLTSARDLEQIQRVLVRPGGTPPGRARRTRP